MSDHSDPPDQFDPTALPRFMQVAIAILMVGAVGVGTLWYSRAHSVGLSESAEKPQPARIERGRAYVLTPGQLAAVTIEAVEQRSFNDEIATEGKILVDEDRTTPIFSPYSGRVVMLFAKPGQRIEVGAPLFSIQATEMVQAQNDFLAGLSALNKSRSQLGLAQIVEKRQRELHEARAIALKEWQVAQNELTAAQNDLRTAEVALEAVRNRLRILGKSDKEITVFQEKGLISPETTINAPIGGTITQRKIGPGQFVNSGASDPAFIIGDLSRVWLIAHVRETDAPKIALGQRVRFRVLALPERKFEAQINYIAASVDPTTRRILVRAEIDNRDDALKPEMYASVRLISARETASPSVPKAAVIYEGEEARVWVLSDDDSVQTRRIKPGIISGTNLQVLEGLKVGERLISKGNLFIDRVAGGEG